MKSLGRTVGGFYAISTIGSVIGTVLTGFVLIAYLGVNNIFYLVGVLLCLLGLGYFLLRRRVWWMSALLLLVFLIPINRPETLPSVLTQDGTRASLVAFYDSHYGSLKVVDYQYQQKHIRDMVVDGAIQGGEDPRPAEFRVGLEVCGGEEMVVLPRLEVVGRRGSHT